jgi:DnaK suppressor protein
MPRATKAGAAGSTTKTAAATTSAKATTRKATTRKAKAKSDGPGAALASGESAASEASDRFVEAQRKQLLAEREAYTKSATSLRAEADQLAQDREPGDVQFDEESGQGDSMNVERERDLALSAQALGSIQEIDVALAKVEKGTYGVCERCGEPIPKERLKALPHAALCVRCKSGGLSRR